jgi:hypothetical protein
VVLSSLAVLASGVWLLLAGPSSRDTVLPIHKVSFIVWLGVTGVHVLGHVLRLPPTLSAEYGHGKRAPGWAVRQAALVVALAAGLALAVVMEPHYGAWQHRFGH